MRDTVSAAGLSGQPESERCVPQLFSKDNRERIKAANPGANFSEMGKLLAQAWKWASAEDRAPYEAAHAVRSPLCLRFDHSLRP